MGIINRGDRCGRCADERNSEPNFISFDCVGNETHIMDCPNRQIV